MEFRFAYPGILNGFVRAGVEANGFSAPDCLIVHQDRGPMSYRQMQEFLAQIEVRNGSGILFGNPLDASVIQKKLLNGTFVYYLTDLSKFVTGILIRTIDSSKTFNEIAGEIYGFQTPNIALTLSRGCSLVLPKTIEK